MKNTTLTLENLVITAEHMRDFCGSFNSLKFSNHIATSIWLIPEATKTAISDNDEYHSHLIKGFKGFLENPLTKECVVDWMTDVRTVEQFTDIELNELLNQYYYIDCEDVCATADELWEKFLDDHKPEFHKDYFKHELI